LTEINASSGNPEEKEHIGLTRDAAMLISTDDVRIKADNFDLTDGWNQRTLRSRSSRRHEL
jgi:hypothetical protein